MKKFVAVVLAVFMLITVMTACGTSGNQKSSETVAPAETKAAQESSTEPAKKLNIIFCNPLSTHPVYVMQENGVRDAANDYGIELTVLSVPTTDGIVEKNVEILENAIAQKPDAILMLPFNDAQIPMQAKAKEVGIPIIATGNDCKDKTQRVAYIGTNNKTMGIMAAELINKATNGIANVAIMMSYLDISNQVEAKAAFEEKIKEFPGIKIAITEADKADMPTALAKFDEIIRANKTIDTVWMLEATGGPAAAKVAKEQNRDIKIIDVDAVKETLDNIKSGAEYATLAQNFYKIGYESLRLAVEWCNGNKDIPIENDSGLIVITKDNVDTYAEDMAKAVRKKGTPWN